MQNTAAVRSEGVVLMRRPGSYTAKQLLVGHGVADLLHAAQRRGVLPHQTLAGTRLFEADLQKPQCRMDFAALRQLLANVTKVPSPELPTLSLIHI